MSLKVDLDVERIARHFGTDDRLLQAVVNAEGDILKAVRCSFPETKDRAAALDILARSAVHAMSDFLKERDLRKDFVQFWARRWAPPGVANDPRHLNENWPGNVTALWL